MKDYSANHCDVIHSIFSSVRDRNELFILLENRSKKMLNKRTTGIQAENMNKQKKNNLRKIKGKTW